MPKLRKHIAIFITSLISLCLTYFAYAMWKEIERNAALSCLSSIAKAAEILTNSGKLQISDRPRKLTKNEINKIFSEESNWDCSGYEGIMANVEIEVDEINGKFLVRVWSNGKDDIHATEDDLVIPYEK